MGYKLLHIGLFDKNEPQYSLRNALKGISSYYEEYDWRALKNINEFLLSKCGFDIIFFQLQSPDVVHKNTFAELSQKSKLFNFSGDVRQPLPKFYIELAPYCTTLFTNLNDVEVLLSLGYDAYYFQIGYNTEFYNTHGAVGEAPAIVFMGNNYNIFPLSEFRRRLVSRLKTKYEKNFGVYGNWENGINLNYRQHEEASMYRGCKVAINLSHFNLKRYSSDRLFRIMACGSLCLSHRYEEIEKEFSDGIHLKTWETLDELENLIDYYLKDENQEERIRIALSGNKLVSEKYTWEYRINNDLLNIIEDDKQGYTDLLAS